MRLIARCFLLPQIMFMVLIASNAQAIDEKAESYYANGEYLKAAKRWQDIGNRDDDDGLSFYRLAELYQEGLGVEEDTYQALKWLQQSAKKGYVPAMYALGNEYMWGDQEVQNIDFAVYWFEKAAEQNHSASILALANFFMAPPRKDILRSKALAEQLIRIDPNAAVGMFGRIDKQVRKLNMGGSRDIHQLEDDSYTLELARFDDFVSAWLFILQNEVVDSLIYRSIYSDFVVVWGTFTSPFDGFQSVRDLPLELQKLKPRVRALKVIKSQILVATDNYEEDWLFEQPSDKYTVELFRGVSPLQAIDFVDVNGLANSSIYRTKFGEYAVIAGVFDSEQLAQTVISKLPLKMKEFNPLQYLFSTVKLNADIDPN